MPQCHSRFMQQLQSICSCCVQIICKGCASLPLLQCRPPMERALHLPCGGRALSYLPAASRKVFLRPEEENCKMFIYIYIYTVLYTYTHTHTHTHTHTYIHTLHYITLHPYIHTSIHPYIHTSIHPYIHPSIHTYIYMYTYMYINIYMYNCIYLYYIYIYVYTDMINPRSSNRSFSCAK